MLRDSAISRVNPSELVVGDIVVLQAGDAIPADCIIIDDSVVYSNESALTGTCLSSYSCVALLV